MNNTNINTANNAAIDINPIPYLTWTWLKINKDSVSYDFSLSENKGTDVQLPQGISVTDGKSVKTELPEPQYAIGQEAAKLIFECAKDGKIYTITKDCSVEAKPLIIRINNDKNSATHQIIHALAGTTSNIIIVYEGGSEAENTLSGVLTKIYAEDDALVNISKVQLCGKNVNQIDETAVVCGQRAKVNFTQIELGGSHVDAGFHTTLEGYQSQFKSDTAYICKGTQYLDMNQVVVHKGKKTICNMKTDGTVKDDTTKTYRGTIDLIKGCSGAEGNEIENTLLLSPKAVVKAAPIILCGEDDIAAEHGSTIGKLSNEMLFYMESHGIDQETAEALITDAKITAAASGIPDEGIQNEILEYINGK